MPRRLVVKIFVDVELVEVASVVVRLMVFVVEELVVEAFRVAKFPVVPNSVPIVAVVKLAMAANSDERTFRLEIEEVAATKLEMFAFVEVEFVVVPSIVSIVFKVILSALSEPVKVAAPPVSRFTLALVRVAEPLTIFALPIIVELAPVVFINVCPVMKLPRLPSSEIILLAEESPAAYNMFCDAGLSACAVKPPFVALMNSAKVFCALVVVALITREVRVLSLPVFPVKLVALTEPEVKLLDTEISSDEIFVLEIVVSKEFCAFNPVAVIVPVADTFEVLKLPSCKLVPVALLKKRSEIVAEIILATLEIKLLFLKLLAKKLVTVALVKVALPSAISTSEIFVAPSKLVAPFTKLNVLVLPI